MHFSDLINPMKAHPYVVVGGVVGVLVVIQMRSAAAKKAAAAAPATGSGVYAMTTDPNQVALQAQQATNAANISMASITANLQQTLGLASIGAQTQIAADQTQVSLAQNQSAQQISLASIAAAIFGTATQGVTANYVSQLVANGASNIAYSNTADATTSGNSGGSNGGNSSWNGGSTSIKNSGTYGTTTNNPAGSAVINTANSQIEQMFNNVIRAGQGISPLETTIMTDGGGSVAAPAPATPAAGGNGSSWQAHGGSSVDPIFANWTTGNPLPSVTDISAAAGSAFGWVGSFINPNTGQQQTVH
jgi:hypothetical protein